MRREGLYASQLATWRQQQQGGALAGPRARRRAEDTAELARSRRDNARLTRDLELAHTIIEVQKTLSLLLGITLPPAPDAVQP